MKKSEKKNEKKWKNNNKKMKKKWKKNIIFLSFSIIFHHFSSIPPLEAKMIKKKW